ncbi:DUF3305 domain-containing protein [Thauera mechernichensis]|jgi:hypothetical protein|uniref:DUF3305 domain-containing protein n=1 Tax=Thauera mechernichensis TaxID=82788 RepID=A0ABW3WB53_9RHOO|nr:MULTISPECIES: DUF3305 domain-containing protein [Thauera]ENO80720.1 hypothetical protein B447_11482 [Thauera sp. 27]ENO92035.1 hypothetical protein C662_13886 [Thauera sp. 28]MDG3065820.1 DUF3305 domain-containing protein [Thauera mechernichensis]WBL64868.1 DUF3305 domain-containing protein [Thauera sp. WB-2]HAG74801.1 DUF3305 domain-containing protein [Thauera sp.]
MNEFPIAVIMECRRLNNPWVDEAWEAVGVVPAFADPGPGVAEIVSEPERRQWRIGGHALALFRDEVDNYFLNMSSPIPKVFVMWRKEGGQALPAAVSVSYGEAARWLDSGEQVDGVAMSREIADWVGDFVNTHYKPAPRRKVRRNDPLAQDRRPQ